MILEVLHGHSDCLCKEPTILFKGKGRVGDDERRQYAKDVQVIFTPKAMINGPATEIYIKNWMEQVIKYVLSRKRNSFVAVRRERDFLGMIFLFK